MKVSEEFFREPEGKAGAGKAGRRRPAGLESRKRRNRPGPAKSARSVRRGTGREGKEETVTNQKQIEDITQGRCSLGIELGSTRIKAVLIDSNKEVAASGKFNWEGRLVKGVWTYSLEEVHRGIQAAYLDLKQDVRSRYGRTLRRVKALGISAMMHGYLAFDKEGKQLAEFRTWRNTFTGEAAAWLSELFGYNIPQRWSVAHLYGAILNEESHVRDLSFLTTLAGYVHEKLTGEKVLGVGDASGMFPIDPATKDYDAGLLEKFDGLGRCPKKLKDLLPKVLSAGEEAGRLQEAGARLLDPEGDLEEGLPLCPPEGDAGTGMVATNAVSERTGNVSVGTSVFAMLVLEKPLSEPHREIDLVTTPDGSLTAMAHCNNGTADIDTWIGLMGEAARALGADFEEADLYRTLYQAAFNGRDPGGDAEGDPDAGGLLHYGYLAGEDLADLKEGRPLFLREAGSKMTLSNFMRSQLYSSLCALKVGLDILTREEGVQVDEIRGHGGFFKAEGIGQRVMAAAINVPVTVLKSAGEGGAWGIALLADYAAESLERKEARKPPRSLPDFLNAVFEGRMSEALKPLKEDLRGFEAYYRRFLRGLPVEAGAVEAFPYREDSAGS